MEIKRRDKKERKINKFVNFEISKFRAVSIFLWLLFFFFLFLCIMLMFLFLSSFDLFLFHSLFRSFSFFFFLTFSLPFGSYGWWVTWLSFWYSETENKKDTPPVGLFRFRPTRNDAKASCLSLRKLTIDHFERIPIFFVLSIFVFFFFNLQNVQITTKNYIQ